MIGNKQHFLIAGATGLVGSSLLDMALNNDQVAKVTVFTRRPLNRTHAKLVEKRVDFETLSEKDLAPNIDAVICCLGTTMARAGGKDAFRRVDYEYVVKLAVFTQRSNIPQFHVISAANANAKSWYFYSKVKGRMEMEIQKLNKIRSIYIYRPSMLLGNRDEFRFGELIGKNLMSWLSFLLPKSMRAVHDAEVAYAMLTRALGARKGVYIIKNQDMQIK